MDVAALVLAIIAVVAFLTRPAGVGLALLTAALICQFVHLTGTAALVHG